MCPVLYPLSRPLSLVRTNSWTAALTGVTWVNARGRLANRIGDLAHHVAQTLELGQLFYDIFPCARHGLQNANTHKSRLQPNVVLPSVVEYVGLKPSDLVSSSTFAKWSLADSNDCSHWWYCGTACLQRQQGIYPSPLILGSLPVV